MEDRIPNWLKKVEQAEAAAREWAQEWIRTTGEPTQVTLEADSTLTEDDRRFRYSELGGFFDRLALKEGRPF